MNKNEIINVVINEIKNRKKHAQNAAEFYLQTQLKNEGFKKHYVAFKTAKLNLAKQEFLKSMDIDKEVENYENIKINFENYIKQENINLQDFLPNYYCKKCNDSGEVDGQKCVCFNTLFSEKLMELSGKNIENLPTFESVMLSTTNKIQEKQFLEVSSVLEKYSSDLKNYPKKTLTIIGKTGVGKTYLASMVLENAIKHGNVSNFVTSIALNQDYLKYHLAPLNEKLGVISKYLDCDLLVIDDLGTEPMLKNVTEEYYYLIITERLSKGKNTVITTNLSQEQIRDVYGERIFSRLFDKSRAIVIKLEGDDLRVKGK